jgi:hypothetical protein
MCLKCLSRGRWRYASTQRTELRDKLNQQVAELNTLKSLPLNLSVPNMRSTGKSSEVCCSHERYLIRFKSLVRASMGLCNDLYRKKNRFCSCR